MPVGQLQRAFHSACDAARAFAVEDLADGKLLEQFLARKDEVAFAEIVRRHGPMVLGVCRRAIGSHHDAEDAFQATFLVLARKAGQLSAYDQVASWLHGVAYRTAQEARRRLARQQSREAPLNESPDRTDDASMRNEIKTILDREVNRLPDKYRLPVVLCELEGLSRSEAARLLQLTEGTLSSRLAAARKALARRLSKFGFSLPVAGLLVFAEQQSIASAVPQRLVEAASSSAVQAVAGQALTAIPEAVLSLADGIIRAMSLGKAKIITVFVITLGMLASGVLIGTSPDATVAVAAIPKVESTPEAEPNKVASVEPERAEDEPKAAIANKPPEESLDLKTRLKHLETDIVKIRQAMLRECQAEEKKLDETIQRAKNDLEVAMKKRNFDAQGKAIQAMAKANADKLQVNRMRGDIETRMRLDDPPHEQRIGLSFSGPGNVIGKLFAGPKDRGLMIERVTRDSAAANAGLQPLDILLEMDGQPVPHGVADFRKMLAQFEPESTVDVTLLRKGRKQTVKGLVMPAAKD